MILSGVVSCLTKVLFHVHKMNFFRVYGKKILKTLILVMNLLNLMTNFAPELT